MLSQTICIKCKKKKKKNTISHKPKLFICDGICYLNVLISMYLKYQVTEYPPAKLSDIWEYQPSDTPQFSNLMSTMGSQFSNLTSTTSSWFFLKLPSWKTVRILEQLMFADKYTYIFLHQIEAIVNIDIFIYIYMCCRYPHHYKYIFHKIS